MAKPDGRIEKGQRLASAISARAWNRAQDAADIVLGVRPGVEAGDGSWSHKPYAWVYCKPNVEVSRWGILEITGLEITPTATDSDAATISFQDAPVITAGNTSATTTAWCVAVDPIASGSIGKVAVAGVVQIKSSDFNKAAGAQLLWKDSNWALILIGGGLRLGTISATWTKGNTATVTEQNGDGSARSGSPTFTATNYFATITVTSGTRRVACGKVDDKWLLIAAECG
jgi:predicted RecA/RadA family phage recombinase